MTNISTATNSGIIPYENNPIRTVCPNCGDGISPVIIGMPVYGQVVRYNPKFIGLVYMCTSCKEPIFFKERYQRGSNAIITIFHDCCHVEFLKIEFDYEFIPKEVEVDLREAFNCYESGCFNAFGAMCRRTIQSAASDLGKKGKTKVQNQINELKEIANLDDETFSILNQIILDGHDGAHPHLPKLSAERAEILLELMKDVMYQLYVRKGKIQKANKLRMDKINESKNNREDLDF